MRSTCVLESPSCVSVRVIVVVVSPSSATNRLHALGYRLQALRKSQEGTSHPDRNKQFEHINATAAALARAGPFAAVERYFDAFGLGLAAYRKHFVGERFDVFA
jgi:hypothetical protein